MDDIVEPDYVIEKELVIDLANIQGEGLATWKLCSMHIEIDSCWFRWLSEQVSKEIVLDPNWNEPVAEYDKDCTFVPLYGGSK